MSRMPAQVKPSKPVCRARWRGVVCTLHRLPSRMSSCRCIPLTHCPNIRCGPLPQDGEKRTHRPLEMFFPFDPYLLRRSSRFLQLRSSYVQWRHGHPATPSASGGVGAVAGAGGATAGPADADGASTQGMPLLSLPCAMMGRMCTYRQTMSRGPAGQLVTEMHILCPGGQQGRRNAVGRQAGVACA